MDGGCWEGLGYAGLAYSATRINCDQNTRGCRLTKNSEKMASPTLFFESLLTSDQIYELGSEQVEKEFTSDDGMSYAAQLSRAKIKYEANYDALALSSGYSFKSSGTTPEENYSQRTIWLGSLDFIGDRLASLTVTKQIKWSSFTDWGQNIIEVKVLESPFYISDATSKDQWGALNLAIQEYSRITFCYDDVNWIDEQTPPVNTSSVLGFLSLPEAQYFETGWDADPTGANVLVDIDLEELQKGGEAQTIERKEVDLATAEAGTSTQQENIIGTSSDDTLAAGKGADKLTGGEGADKFAFNTPDKFGKKGADIITDFNPGQGDQIFVSANALPGLRANPSFVIATSKKALKAAQKSESDLIYYQPFGQLFYDQNGSAKGFGSGGLFAVLSGAPVLTAENLGVF